jgi:hypothetical protein
VYQILVQNNITEGGREDKKVIEYFGISNLSCTVRRVHVKPVVGD